MKIIISELTRNGIPNKYRLYSHVENFHRNNNFGSDGGKLYLDYQIKNSCEDSDIIIQSGAITVDENGNSSNQHDISAGLYTKNYFLNSYLTINLLDRNFKNIGVLDCIEIVNF